VPGGGTTAEDPVMRILAARAGQVDRGDEMWRSRVQRALREASTGAVGAGRGPSRAQESRPGGGVAWTCTTLVRGLIDSMCLTAKSHPRTQCSARSLVTRKGTTKVMALITRRPQDWPSILKVLMLPPTIGGPWYTLIRRNRTGSRQSALTKQTGEHVSM
jgi:hypothetical protein